MQPIQGEADSSEVSVCVQSWHTLRSRQGLHARGAFVRQDCLPSSYQPLAGSYYTAGAHASS